jgi:hypothetical protein
MDDGVREAISGQVGSSLRAIRKATLFIADAAARSPVDVPGCIVDQSIN